MPGAFLVNVQCRSGGSLQQIWFHAMKSGANLEVEEEGYYVAQYSNMHILHVAIDRAVMPLVKWGFVRPKVSSRPTCVFILPVLDAGHVVHGPCGPAGPGTDKPTKSCKHSFSWEDMRLRYIYFFRHLRKHKRRFLTFRQTTGMSVHALVFLLCHLKNQALLVVWLQINPREMTSSCPLYVRLHPCFMQKVAWVSWPAVMMKCIFHLRDAPEGFFSSH